MKGFFAKAGSLLLLLIVLGSASSMVNGVVSERARYRDQAQEELQHSLAGKQTLAAGVMVVPYTESWNEPEIAQQDGKYVPTQARKSRVAELIVLPESLDIQGQLAVDPRRRGLFRVNGFIFNGTLQGQLRMPQAEAFPRQQAGSVIEVGLPRLVFALSGKRGLRQIDMQIENERLENASGTGLPGAREGVSAPLRRQPAGGEILRFKVQTEIGGAERLDFLPLGKENRSQLISKWPHPSFTGSLLPSRSDLSSTGFSAQWQSTALAANTRERWPAWAQSEHPDGALPSVAEAGEGLQRSSVIDSFAVAMRDPVDIYTLSDRATKYALLFIVLTLGGFALYEILGGLRLHPLQYLMVGLALVLFFLLLLALAEHIGFALAYLLASGACLGLIGVYLSAIIASRLHAASFSAVLALLYGALYGILRSEQNALMLGSVLLFALLAACMVLTRRVNWYQRLASREALADAA